jgi:hypothetical protein
LIFEFKAQGIFHPRVIFEYLYSRMQVLKRVEIAGKMGNQQNKGRIAAQQQAPVAS